MSQKLKSIVFMVFVLAGCYAGAASAQYGQRFSPNGQQQMEVRRDSSVQGFDPHKLFVGGNLGLSFGDFTYINVSPLVGYRFSELFAAGVQVNTQYESVRYTDETNSTWKKDRYGVLGAGVFARVYPIPQLFVHVQPEMNFIMGKEKFFDGTPEQKYHTHVASFLAGGGYAQSIGGTSEFTIMILYDLLQNSNSPYGNQPIFRAGVNLGF